jgi:hypothetical protein
MRRLAAVLVVSAIVLTGCGGDDDDDAATQSSSPTTEASSDASSIAASDATALDGIPLPEGAEPGKEGVERTDFVVEYYVVDGATPEEILGFYTANLGDAGFEPVYAPRDAGGGVWRGLWSDGGDQQLVVSAADADGGTELTLSKRDAPPTGA